MSKEYSHAKAVIEELGSFLDSKMPLLNQVLEEWPSGNRKLKYPSLSILTSGNVDFTPEMEPYIFQSEQKNGATYKFWYVDGTYEIPLQLDFWCRNKPERNKIMESFKIAFADQFPQHGLLLELSSYHNVKAQYILRGYNYEDSEIASQKKEWRVKIDVLASCRSIIERSESAILTTDADVEVKDKPSLTEE